MQRQVIHTPKVPPARVPLSQAIRAGDWIFASGQLGNDPRTGRLAEGGIAAQTRQVCEHLKAIFETGGSSLAKVVKVTIYMVDLAELPEMNAVFSEYFPKDPPARTTFQCVGLVGAPAWRSKRSRLSRRPLLDAEKVDVEEQRRVRRNLPAARIAVGERGRNHEPPRPADFHTDDTLIPTTDHLSDAEREGEGRLADRGVELQALVVRLRRVVQPAGVVHGHRRAADGVGAGPDDDVGLRERDARRG